MKFDKNLSAIHAYLCADGYVIRNPESQKQKYYHIGLRNTNMVLLKDFQERFKQRFGLEPIITNEGRCRIGNKEIYYFLTKDYSYYSYEWEMPNLNKENLKLWLRTFFDCEAWVVLEKAKNRLIGMDSVNESGIYQIKGALKRFNIDSKIKKLDKRGIFRLFVYGKENLIRFQERIDFLHPSKKEKLDLAIKSYVNYEWKFPEDKKELKRFVKRLLKDKIGKSRVKISSIRRNNLVLLQKHLKRLFSIESNIYDCRRYYELNVSKKEDIIKIKEVLRYPKRPGL